MIMPSIQIFYTAELKKYMEIYKGSNNFTNLNDAVIDSLEVFYGLRSTSKNMEGVKSTETGQKQTISTKADIDVLLTKTLPALKFAYKELLLSKLKESGTITVILEGQRLRVL